MRSLLWSLQSAALTAASLLATLRRQRLTALSPLALAVLVLALLFAFLAAAPFLSPFVYPLF